MTAAAHQTRIALQHHPDGSMTLTFTNLVTGVESAVVLDEAERRSLLRGVVAPARDVRGYVILTPDADDPGRYDVNWDGVLYPAAVSAHHEVDTFASNDYPDAHVGMVLAVLGGPDDEMPTRSVKDETS